MSIDCCSLSSKWQETHILLQPVTMYLLALNFDRLLVSIHVKVAWNSQSVVASYDVLVSSQFRLIAALYLQSGKKLTRCCSMMYLLAIDLKRLHLLSKRQETHNLLQPFTMYLLAIDLDRLSSKRQETHSLFQPFTMYLLAFELD